MLINIVISNKYEGIDFDGYSPMYQMQLVAWMRQRGYLCVPTKGDLIDDADLIVLIVQYPHESDEPWFNECLSRASSKQKVILSGKAATIDRKRLISVFRRVDFIIVGEPFKTLASVVTNINSLNDDITIPGLLFLNDRGECIETEQQNALTDYDEVPIASQRYLTDKENSISIHYMETSYECHGKCNFCSGLVYRNLIPGCNRYMSAERIVNEIKYMNNKYNIKVFVFYDENFFLDNDYGYVRAKEFARLLEKANLRIRFTIECRADNIHYDIINYLKSVGLYTVFVGIESGSRAVLDRYHKHISLEQNHTALQILRKLKVRCRPGYIFFDPLTTKNELQESIELFEEYSDILYVHKQDNNGLLWFPAESAIVKYMHEHGVDVHDSYTSYPFVHEETRNIYKKLQYLKKNAAIQNNKMNGLIALLKSAIVI